MLRAISLYFALMLISNLSSAEALRSRLIHLKEQANLKPAQMLIQKDAKVAFVQRELIRTAEATQGPIIGILESANLDWKAFYITNTIAVKDLPLDLEKQLLLRDDVERISKDVQVRMKLPEVDQSQADPIKDEDIPGHIKIIRAHQVWKELGVRGKGIVLAGQDTGYYMEHRSLRSQYRGSFAGGSFSHDYNWHDALEKNANPVDDTGHGTHTMGTMLGLAPKNAIGVAPEAQWIGCRNMKGGVGSLSTYLECSEFLMAPYPFGGNSRTEGRTDLAPHIVNNSWGCPISEGCSGADLLGAIRAFKAAGIFFVAAAGNDGPSCGTVNAAPAFYSNELMSVGAYNRYQKDIASFSSRGPSTFDGGIGTNIIAYGDSIRSAIPGGPDRYDDKAGTSMAAPQAAGVIALLWSHRPELIGDIDRTTQILYRTAKPMTSSQNCGSFPGAQIPNAVFGFGMVDAYAALTYKGL